MRIANRNGWFACNADNRTQSGHMLYEITVQVQVKVQDPSAFANLI
jgi:hypothetical protein